MHVDPDARGPRTLTAQYSGDATMRPDEDEVIHQVNRLPVIGPLTYTMGTGGQLSVPATQGVLAAASDADGDSLVVLNVGPNSTQGVSGTATLEADGAFTFLPSGNLGGVAVSALLSLVWIFSGRLDPIAPMPTRP